MPVSHLDENNIETFLPLIWKIFKQLGLLHGRLLTWEDFMQAGYEAIVRDWNRYGKGRDPVPAYGYIIRSGMVDAFRAAGLTKRRVVPEPSPTQFVDIDTLEIALNQYPDTLERAIEFDQVVRLLTQLPEREALVLRGILVHGLSQVDMMEALHVTTEGRVSQIRASGVIHMQKLIVIDDKRAKDLISSYRKGVIPGALFGLGQRLRGR